VVQITCRSLFVDRDCPGLVATQGVFSFRGRGIGDLKSVSLNATPLAITNLVKVLFVLNGMSTTSPPNSIPTSCNGSTITLPGSGTPSASGGRPAGAPSPSAA
jgi:hypothetical protein